MVAPSYSPENRPVVNGKRDFVVVAGTTMDNQMVYDLFYNTIQAAKLMNENIAFTDSLQAVSDHLAPMQVGRWGQLQEWMEDWDNPKDHHRHVSHLWGLYPGRQISDYNSPVLFEAAKNPSSPAAITLPAGPWGGKSAYGHACSTAIMPTS